jgi:hypothetical protein
MYNYNDQVKEDEMGRACSMNGEKRNAYTRTRILVGKSERKRRIGSPGRKWVGNTKMDLEKIEGSNMDWIYMA